MNIKIDRDAYTFDGSKKVKLDKLKTKEESEYSGKLDFERLSEEFSREIDELQSKMYAHNRYGLLIIFQAMDAAGKDSTIKHVMSGVNTHGVKVFAYKKPSIADLEHDYLWRTNINLPERGCITIFNRSYYEEVLIVKVHPEILKHTQMIPEEHLQDLDKVFKNRYTDMQNFEKYAHRNGIHIMKFFLHVSKLEQGKRMLERIDTPSKNWKFEEVDVRERAFWKEYMKAYEDCINNTASAHAPWHIIPADDKKHMRLIVSSLILEKLKSLKIEYPVIDGKRKEQLNKFKQLILEQDRGEL
jgi:PPK2 family polyphosphate:nucleotide phosphotransferase